MGLVSKPYTFSAGGSIVAAEHNENFNTLYSLVNGNLSTSNLSATAGIVDTQLAQITTANKVAVSAIESADLTITSLQLEETTAPTTAASEGALYTKDTSGQPELFFREESDGDEVQITSGGELATTGLGAIAPKADNTSHLADTDGFVVGSASFGASSTGTIYSDASNPPITVVGTIGVATGGETGTTYHQFCFPVKKGNYYKVNLSSGSNKIINWIPLGV